ncbi:MAG: holo-ACP synthase [Anaerolineales bacterium]|nr:holo-ACP synthase [Anaerolineales bacterium]MCB8967671.1 holo-ACP synthase [Ardenticatenaceae bacterium]
MLTVGVDLSEVARIEALLNRYGDRFRNRVFTEREQVYCNGRITSLAGRFAIKEAVAKALGTGIGAVLTWKDIEVVNDDRGKPELVLHNQAQTLAHELGLQQWAISLSHTDSLAIGFVVATGSDQI